jgi:hypothetical protein
MQKIKSILVISFCFSIMASYGQITVSNSTLPKIGDVLKTVTTDAPSLPVNVGAVNGPQTWNFSQLNQGERITTCFKAPQSSTDFASFPNANLLITDDSGQDQFCLATAGSINLLGFGGDNGFLPVPIKVSFSQNPTIRRAPITFIQSANSVGKFNLDLGSDIIPDSLLSSLPISIDSLRIQFSSEESGIVDAFGTVKMQNKDTEVLREKIRSITDTKLFIKIPFIGWIDPTPLLGGGEIPGGLGGFLGADTSTVYRFYSATHKEILVEAEFNTDNTFRSVTFADIGGIISATTDPKIELFNLQSVPNPTTSVITLKANDLARDQYILSVSDMSGKILKISFDQLEGDFVKEIDLSNMSSGIYQVQLINKSRTRSYSTRIAKI